MTKINYYVIDTSSLIDLNYRYPVDIFPGIWRNLEKLIDRGFLISPVEVLNEIKDEALKEWAKKHKNLFRELDELQIKIVKEILAKFPTLAKPDKDGPQADPFVIALAISLEKDTQQTLIETVRKRLIVTEERIRGNKIKIPYICRDYDIDCINIIELFRTEGWKFQ